jgi:NADH dehydrogenase
MVKSILKTINKKRFVIEMPMPIAKIQSFITDLLPIPPILTKDQCEILSESDNVVSNNNLTLKDLDINPTDVEEAMKKWLWRYKDGGQFAKAQ